jgi:hypothetical protein
MRVFNVTVLAKVRWLDFSLIFQSSHSRIVMIQPRLCKIHACNQSGAGGRKCFQHANLLMPRRHRC